MKEAIFFVLGGFMGMFLMCSLIVSKKR